MSIKFGTPIQHAHGYKLLPRVFLIFTRGLGYGISKLKKKNGVKLLLNFERSQLIPGAQIKNSKANFCRPTQFFFHSAQTVCVGGDSLTT